MLYSPPIVKAGRVFLDHVVQKWGGLDMVVPSNPTAYYRATTLQPPHIIRPA